MLLIHCGRETMPFVVVAHLDGVGSSLSGARQRKDKCQKPEQRWPRGRRLDRSGPGGRRLDRSGPRDRGMDCSGLRGRHVEHGGLQQQSGDGENRTALIGRPVVGGAGERE